MHLRYVVILNVLLLNCFDKGNIFMDESKCLEYKSKQINWLCLSLSLVLVLSEFPWCKKLYIKHITGGMD